MSIILMVVLTVLSGYLGAGILGSYLNWPDAGSVTSVAVMGAFILWELRKTFCKKDKEE